MEIIIIIPCLGLLAAAYIGIRNEFVARFRSRIVDTIFQSEDWENLVEEFGQISYDAMVFSFKRLRIDCWYSPAFCAKITRSAKSVILPGMPHLEWMTENLSGFGGTEIDGRTYYTWEEAMTAAKQLGDGWRLPTREEFEQLCDLGSEWQENGPHGLPGRLFGGELFLEAAGYRHRESGALSSVGTEGYWWSSSSYAAGSVNAGNLSFHSGGVSPLYGNGRAYVFSVRCVRNVK